MIEKSGKTLTISQILETNEDKYRVEEMGFVWTNEMFEEVLIPDYVTYVNTSSDSCNPHWQPLTAADFGKISSITMTVDDMKKSIEKENSKMDFEEILIIYKRRELDCLHEEFEKFEEKLKSKDKIQKIIKKAEEDIHKIYEEEGFRDMTVFLKKDYLTKEIKEKINEKRFEVSKKEYEINQLIDEVKAQLNAIPNDTDEKYYFAIEILKNYEILDEKGRINA